MIPELTEVIVGNFDKERKYRRDIIELCIIWGLVVIVFLVLEFYYRTFGSGNIWDLIIY